MTKVFEWKPTENDTMLVEYCFSSIDDCLKIVDIRCKSHNNEDGKYRSIPRSIYEPDIVDEDAI